jgi:hypothetical protein
MEWEDEEIWLRRRLRQARRRLSLPRASIESGSGRSPSLESPRTLADIPPGREVGAAPRASAVVNENYENSTARRKLQTASSPAALSSVAACQRRRAAP